MPGSTSNNKGLYIPRYKKDRVTKAIKNNSVIKAKLSDTNSIKVAILEFQRKIEIEIKQNETRLKVFARIFLFLVDFQINLLAIK